jgi:hypothetical protein
MNLTYKGILRKQPKILRIVFTKKGSLVRQKWLTTYFLSNSVDKRLAILKKQNMSSVCLKIYEHNHQQKRIFQFKF